MSAVTFQILEGINKGRVYRDLSTPVTIGREEGNLLRLDDERVSRYHAKVQYDNGEVILTDMESTNGTRVNGNVITIRRLKAGDQIGVGRSILLFGSEEEIRSRVESMTNAMAPPINNGDLPATVHASNLFSQHEDQDQQFDLNEDHRITMNNGTLYVGNRPLPPLPSKMSPSQTARLSEMLDFFHRHLVSATENIQANEETGQVTLNFADWQRVLGVQMLLARYVRAVCEPDALHS